jgi:tripartite-type tricarboxylate transporter receptor subunit TctC
MKKRRLGITFIVLAFMLTLTACGGSSSTGGNADDFPNKELTIIVSNKAGGSNDQAARSIVPYLEDALGVPVVVKNVGAAGGNVARAEISNADPDGYTLLETPMPSMGIGELVADGDFKTLELTPVFNLYGHESNVIVVAADSPIQTFEDLVEASKEKRLTASGSGTATNAVLGSIFLKNIGVEHDYVPFKGGTEAATQVAGGHVDFGTSSEIAAAPLVQEGKLRVLASTGPKRSDRFPDAPTLVELGHDKSQFTIIYGFWAPPGTPDEIVNKLADAFKEASEDEEFREVANNIGFTLDVKMPEEFSKAVEDSYNLVKELKKHFSVE